MNNSRIVVTIPCFNEESSIKAVIENFQRILPEAEIIIFDNASTDRTREIALQSGAQVIKEYRRGKGNVVQAIFTEVEADVYVLVRVL